MIIIGAKGHAKEIFEIFKESELSEALYFFDDINKDKTKTLFNCRILKNLIEVESIFSNNKKFCLGIGKPQLRSLLAEKLINQGGIMESVISQRALVAQSSVIESGVNLMPFSAVYNCTKIGKGALINSFASVHHDCIVGDFTEVSPGSRVLGRSKIGAFCSLGANSVVLPKIEICDNVTIGAGAVVTKSISHEGTYVGIPAKKIN